VPYRHGISTATVVMLVVLRLNIGWHFFHEGVKHYTDPQWTSEATLRGAKGPLAPFYQSYLPDFHGLDDYLHGPRPEKDSARVKAWIDQIQADWNDQIRPQFVTHYDLDKKQQERATQVTHDYQAKVRSWYNAHKEDLENHVHQWQRTERSREAPDAGSVPFRKQRVAQSQALLAGEASTWRTELSALEHEYQGALAEVLSDEQQAMPPVPRPATSIDLVDKVMTYAILAIGLLLLVGLFTRSACVAGALFLLSVISMQPFWVSETIPTYNQFVEMFALLTLATTHVGRWGGLDFFVHHLLWGRAGATKGTDDVPKS
jgi:uncharacterized membrane protein YphA (DoxX/SURF4 family)